MFHDSQHFHAAWILLFSEDLSEAVNDFCIHGADHFHGQADTGFKIIVGRDAIVRVDVSYRYADYDDRNAIQRCIDYGAVVSSAFPYRCLYRDAFFCRQIECVALIARGADDGAVHEGDSVF